jgi:hypothetical protein
MFRCLVMYINLVKMCYVHAGLAIFYLATILRPDHVCGVQWSRVWRKSRFLERSIGRRQHVGAWCDQQPPPVPTGKNPHRLVSTHHLP